MGYNFIVIISWLEAPNDSKTKITKNRNISLIKVFTYLFSLIKKSFAILKLGIIVLSTFMSSPVLGFLPILASLIEGEKAPNLLNSALFPFDNANVISPIIISKIFSESLIDILFFSEN